MRQHKIIPQEQRSFDSTNKHDTDTTTICFDINKNLAQRIKSTSLRENISDSDFINTIISEYFRKIDYDQETISHKDPREHARKDILIRGAIEINQNNKETLFKPVDIVDISLGGIKITVDNNASRVIDIINAKSSFTLIFCLPSLPNVFKTLCKPIHMSKKGMFEIGASFINISESSFPH